MFHVFTWLQIGFKEVLRRLPFLRVAVKTLQLALDKRDDGHPLAAPPAVARPHLPPEAGLTAQGLEALHHAGAHQAARAPVRHCIRGV